MSINRFQLENVSFCLKLDVIFVRIPEFRAANTHVPATTELHHYPTLVTDLAR